MEILFNEIFEFSYSIMSKLDREYHRMYSHGYSDSHGNLNHRISITNRTIEYSYDYGEWKDYDIILLNDLLKREYNNFSKTEKYNDMINSLKKRELFFNVIIAGTRSFNNYELLKNKCDSILSNIKVPIRIVSGTAQGGDKLGERYAKERGYDVIQFEADWHKYGKSAGYKRNQQMADNAQSLICFWDNKSKGTGHMINIANAKPLQYIRVIIYKE